MLDPRHTQARQLRFALAAACVCVLLGVRARATMLFVDGGCPTSGTGTSLDCLDPGGNGPFRTITEGILAMQAGDTLNIRGAHGASDGVYFESLALRELGPLPGKSLDCSAAPCVIQGCRAGTCPTDEQPIIRGMTRRLDWVPSGNGVWTRTMEGCPNPDGLERDAFDPHMVMEGAGNPLTPMAYAGDGVAAPATGQWSYDPTMHQIAVNPTSGADPATTVYVPHFGYNLHIQSPSASVTVRYLTFEGTRGRSIDVETLPPREVTGVFLTNLVQRYVPRYFIIATRKAPGLVIQDSLAEYGCRGFSWAQPTNGGCMGYRLFGVHGGVVERNIIRHIGATGGRKFGGSSPWPCPWCDPPWNDPTYTQNSAYGLAYQIKQTLTATVQDNLAEDVATGGISLDVSRGVTVQRNNIRRAATGVGVLNFTPTANCPTTDPSEFCYNSDHVIRSNVLDQVGFDGGSGCAIDIIAGSERQLGATMLAQVYNNIISRIGFAGICTEMDFGTPMPTPTADVSILNNTLYGVRPVMGADPPSGIAIHDATQNVVVENNALDALTGDGIVVGAAAPSGLTLDGDVIGTVGPCEVLWPNGTANGSCDALTAHEPNGHTGPLLFANVSSTPLDLHLTAGSAAIDAGVNDGVTVDIDGNPRPLGAGWDAGADEFGAPIPTTTTTTTTTATTSPSTPQPTSTSAPRATSTSLGPPTTTTTLGAINVPLTTDRLSGQVLLLTVDPTPGARRFRMVSTDRRKLTIGDAGSIPALLTAGGSVRIVAVGGDGFGKTYDLEPQHWQLIDPRHPGRGLLFVDEDGPINEVRFEVGRRLVVRGSGAELEQSLVREPSVVEVQLRIGSHEYCLVFGGQQQQFASRRRLRRTKARRPSTCPPL